MIYDASLESARELSAGTAVSGLLAHPRSAAFLSWDYDGAIHVWDVENGSERVLVETRDTNPAVVAMDQSGRWLATGTHNSQLLLWDLSHAT
jgi:WD40 repeat protein